MRAMHSTRRARWTRLPLLAAVLVALLVPPAAAQKTLYFVPQADLKNTDPVWTTANITLLHGLMVYDFLFGKDSNYEVHPQMVDTYEVSDDKLTWTFTLRPGLLFHDGDTVRSSDAVASIKRWGERDALGQKMFASTDRWEIVNDRTFKLHLNRPFGLVLEALGKFDANIPVIMKEEDAQTDPYTQVKSHIGSGPFRMVEDEWEPGNQVVYEKFEDYKPRPEPVDWYAGGKVVHVDRVVWKYIPDQATAVAALRRGEVDFFEKPETDLMPVLESDPNVVVKPNPLIFQGYMALNWKWAPFDNLKARRAMQYMVNQEDYVRSIIGDPKYYTDFCGAMFICSGPYATDVGSEPVREHGVDKARRLMKESGYDGYPVVLMDPTDFPVLHGAALVSAQKMREIGINVDVQAMDWSTLTSRRAETKDPRKGGWNIFHTWWTSGSLMLPASHPGVTGACDKAWFGWPCDEKLQELSNQWPLEPDPEKRKEIAAQIQKRAYEVVAYVPFGQWTRPLAYRKGVKNLEITPNAVFWGVDK